MISLCIISRKEDEESLFEAITSVINTVPNINSLPSELIEVVVVDTTKEGSISKDFANKFFNDQVGQSPVRVIPFKWTNDFAAARNFSFEQATHEVILWLDSDDIVKNPEVLPKLAEKLENGDVDWIFSEYIYSRDEAGNITARHWVPRMIRKGTGHWVGRVHESLIPDIAIIQEKDLDLSGRLVIEHQKIKDEDYAASSERNLAIQRKELAEEGESVDPRTLMYTGMTYQSMKKYAEAIPYYIRHIKVSGSKEDKYWSAYRIGLCSLLLGEPDQALSPLLDSLKLFPEWQSSYFLLAACYSAMEQWDKVIEWTLSGRSKDRPDTLQVLSDMDYTILPMARLAEAYLHTGLYEEALVTAQQLVQANPHFSPSKELLEQCREAVHLEKYVTSFLTVAQNFSKYDRVKTASLFDLIPQELDDDSRIQKARSLFVPPKVWPKKSIVIYCGTSLEEWAYPSIFIGIGGSETAVIQMSKELVSQGYAVTVYNRCGELKGTYDGVEYKPYYHFNPKDSFDTLISWRQPGIFMSDLNAKKKYIWLHDIASPEQFNETILKNVDKVLFLSKWHRNNVPEIPEEKVFITNNGILPTDYENLPPKRPNSLFWGSSYDRGLLPFIKNIWPLIQKEIPDVTLDVAYGWQNIEKEMQFIPSLKDLYTELSPLLESTPGITHHGRVSHKKLITLMGSSRVYPYASEFGETCNITSMMCQAAGCYVVTTSQAGGTPERVVFGQVQEGDGIYSDEKLQKEFSERVIDYLKRADHIIKTDYNNLATVKKYLLEGVTTGASGGYSWFNTTNHWVKDLL